MRLGTSQEISGRLVLRKESTKERGRRRKGLSLTQMTWTLMIRSRFWLSNRVVCHVKYTHEALRPEIRPKCMPTLDMWSQAARVINAFIICIRMKRDSLFTSDEQYIPFFGGMTISILHSYVSSYIVHSTSSFGPTSALTNTPSFNLAISSLVPNTVDLTNLSLHPSLNSSALSDPMALNKFKIPSAS